jgi:hypothetical protein
VVKNKVIKQEFKVSNVFNLFYFISGRISVDRKLNSGIMDSQTTKQGAKNHEKFY